MDTILMDNKTELQIKFDRTLERHKTEGQTEYLNNKQNIRTI